MLTRESIRLKVTIFTFVVCKMVNHVFFVVLTDSHRVIKNSRDILRSMVLVESVEVESGRILVIQ